MLVHESKAAAGRRKKVCTRETDASTRTHVADVPHGLFVHHGQAQNYRRKRSMGDLAKMFKAPTATRPRVKALVFGASGVGKTYLALSAPGKIAMIDTEAGSSFYSNRGLTDYDVLHTKSYRDVKDAIGQLAAAHQAGALQEPQVPVDGGQPMPLRALPEAFMQLLAAELGIRLLQHGQQGPLPGPQGHDFRIGGMGVWSHGRTARCATC
jgi:hypothetical protein